MKNRSFLFLDNLSASVFGSSILKGISLSIMPGTVHALMGPNGSGKSTLAYTLMGHPHYKITSGSINFDGDDISALSPDKRAQRGLFLAFQHPLEVPGVSVSSFLKEAYCAVKGESIAVPEFQKLLLRRMEQLDIDPAFAFRGLNEGFSGGEKKRLELLQLLLLQPRLVILDEIDSGMDIDALKIIARGLGLAREENPAMGILIITHYPRILHYVIPDCVHVLCDGHIVARGDATLADSLEVKGYDGFKKAAQITP